MLQRSIISDEKPISLERSPASDENVGVLVTRNFKHDRHLLALLLLLKLLPYSSKISLKSKRVQSQVALE